MWWSRETKSKTILLQTLSNYSQLLTMNTSKLKRSFVAKVEVIGAPNHPYNHTIKVDYVHKPCNYGFTK